MTPEDKKVIREATGLYLLCLVVLLLLVGGYIYSKSTYVAPVKPQQAVKQPVNVTKTGESAGRNIGRFGRGLFRGLWNSGDDK